MSCVAERVVSSCNTSDILCRFLIRFSAEAPDVPILIETFVAFPLILRATPAHGKLYRYFMGVSRWIFSIYPLGSTTDKYLDFCPTSHSKCSRLWTANLQSTFLTFLSADSRLIFSILFCRPCHGKFIDMKTGASRLIISIYFWATYRNVFPLLFPQWGP
jgi:hypothetical protein